MLFVLLTAGCGYIGEPLPPLANIPDSIRDLAAIQRGARIIIHFTPPQQTTEGRAVRQPLEYDLRIGTAVVPFSPEAWAAAARRIPQPPVVGGMAQTEIPTTAWTGHEVTLAVRSTGPNRKASAWSNFVNLTIVPPPPRPGSLRAESTADGVRLTWQGDTGDYVVLRRSGQQTGFLQIGEAHGPEFLDRSAGFDTAYVYQVQRIVKPGNGRIAESDLSEEVSITPKDIFPPAAPAGLRVVAAPGSIELTWDQNTEPDLAGYRVYRALPGGPWTQIAEVGQVPAYSDHAVEAGKTYQYAVTAVDRAGNQSARSAAAEATVP